MDLSVNKSAKDFLKAQFQNWYAEQVVTYIDKNSDKVEAVKIDFTLTKMKPLGAKWLVKLYDHLLKRMGMNNFNILPIFRMLFVSAPLTNSLWNFNRFIPEYEYKFIS
jgi:hypothetical protein